MHKNATSTLKILLFIFIVCFIASCSDSGTVKTNPEPKPEPPKKPSPTRFKDIGPVAADGVLETVTWNLEWYGHDWGPDDEEQQTKNFLTILDKLHADLYAFQEISSGDKPYDDNFTSEESLRRLTSNMKGYRGFVAKGIDQSQKTAFVYNTKVIDALKTGLITQGQEEYNWASGRYPFYFKFNYNYKGKTVTFYVVVIHAKANTGNSSEKAESYQRREDAARSLYKYLIQKKADANIILLGDYNDDVDVSIYKEKNSPYKPFITHNNKFRIVTKSLSKKKQATSTVSYSDIIDHITVSDELFEEYIKGSTKVITKATEFISSSPEEYSHTTTDHYPVWAKFKM